MFFIDIYKVNGDEYETGTLSGIQRSIQRNLEDQNSPFNIQKDQEFVKSRSVLAAKLNKLLCTSTSLLATNTSARSYNGLLILGKTQSQQSTSSTLSQFYPQPSFPELSAPRSSIISVDNEIQHTSQLVHKHDCSLTINHGSSDPINSQSIFVSSRLSMAQS